MTAPENLELAFWKASRGKRAHADQRTYAARLDGELARLRKGLVDGSYPIGNYKAFTIFEPKMRTICAAAFGERVLHHALVNVLEPWFEKWLVYDTYACRRGKGQLKAVQRARTFARRHAWYMKCDFHKFFDSIPHEGLFDSLNRKFKDRAVVGWLERIVETYETTPGRGLPIGNLTSQHLANLYLDALDRFHVRAFPQRRFDYVRYMDDFVYWGDSKADLIAFRERLVEFAESQLGLTLKQTPVIGRSSHGMDFLGLRVYPTGLRAARKSIDRFKSKVRRYDALLAGGVWSQETYQSRMTALTAFLEEADTRAWRRRFLRDLGTRRGASGSNRVMRGGNYNNNAQNCRSAYRNNNNPSNNNNNGFRLCCSAALQSAPQARAKSAVPAECLSVADAAAKTRIPDAAGSASEVRERRERFFFDWNGECLNAPEPTIRDGGLGGEPSPHCRRMRRKEMQ